MSIWIKALENKIKIFSNFGQNFCAKNSHFEHEFIKNVITVNYLGQKDDIEQFAELLLNAKNVTTTNVHKNVYSYGLFE